MGIRIEQIKNGEDINTTLGINEGGPNLHDPSQDVSGEHWRTDGTIEVTNNRRRSQYYDVLSGKYVYLKQTNTTRKNLKVVLTDDTFNLIDVISASNLASISFIVPTGVTKISFNTFYIDTDMGVVYFQSDYDIGDRVNEESTSNVSTKDNGFRDIREQFRNDFKGRSIAPDSNFKDFDLATEFISTGNWSSTAISPFALKDTSHFNITKVNDVPIYGSGLRLVPNQVYSTTVRDFSMLLSRDYLQSKGVTDGDIIRTGFWIKADQPLEQILMIKLNANNEPTPAFSSLDKVVAITNEEWTWVEDSGRAFDSTAERNYLPTGVFSQATGTALDSFVITGLTVMNITNNTWFGYEENYESTIENEVNSVLSAGIEAEINNVLETNKVVLDNSNTQLYGGGIPSFREQLRTLVQKWGKPASAIKIAVLADSIFTDDQGVIDVFSDWLLSEFGIPKENVDISGMFGGYFVREYYQCLEQNVIFPGVDLLIFAEAGEFEGVETLIKYVQANCSASIMMGHASKRVSNIGIEEPLHNQVRDMAHRLGVELLDFPAILERAQADGDYLKYYRDDLHLSKPDGVNLYVEDLKKHIKQDRNYNEYVVNPKSIKHNIVELGTDFIVPLNGIIYSGSWSGNVTGGNLVSSTSGDYIEHTFQGSGIEFLFEPSSATHTVALNGNPVSDYQVGGAGRYLEYCTTIIDKVSTNDGVGFHRFFRADVTAPFLLESEDSLEFEITIDAITRDGSNNITALTYTLKVDDGGLTTLGTGSIFQDETFAVRTTGEITIPAEIFGEPNFKEESGGDPNEPGSGFFFTVGDTMQFFAKKTWVNNFTSSSLLLKISALEKSDSVNHTVRITKDDNQQSQITLMTIYN